MFIELITLIASLVVLAKASDLVIVNAVKLSNFFGISHLAVGFLLVAVITSLPELSVSVISSQMGEGAIAAGNVFGSNIANILLILGAGAFFYGMKIDRKKLGDIGMILVLTTIISVYIVFSSMLFGRALGMVDGTALLILFLVYAYYILKKGRISWNGKEGGVENGRVYKHQAFYAFIYFAFSIIVVLVSASFVVSSAVSLASLLGIAESFIGATVIAVGTSLPELSIDLQAIRKRHYGIALGDAIGSNIANITFVLGVAAVINPITIVLPVFIAALLFAVVANIVLFYVAAVDKKLGRLGGFLFLFMYAIYIMCIFYLQLSEVLPPVP